MVCKFRAYMRNASNASRRTSVFPALLCAFCALALAASAQAERADRTKPMEVVAERSSTVDLVNQVGRFNGNVVVTQGTMTIHADRLEIRETEGYKSGTAWGSQTAQVKYRQKRDGVDEYVEGSADRVDFDGKSETLRFTGNSLVRRTRGNEMVEEILGELITWNHAAEQFSVQGGRPTAANPGGGVRTVFTPRLRASEPAASAAPPRRPAR